MDSPLKTFDPATEEAASLYVLELLPPGECRNFEQSLAGDPALRELVHDLQGNLEAMALESPVRPAPVHVWARIAAEVNTTPTPILGFPVRITRWLPRARAMAACITLGALLHAWLAPSPKTSTSPIANQTEPLRPATGVTPPSSVTPPAVLIPEVTVAPPPASPTNVVTARETERLRERVRGLATQVAALNQVLAQQSALPSGFTRLHVFRLANTNGASSGRAELEPQSLPDTLAALAAGHHAVPVGATGNQPAEKAAAMLTGTPDTRSDPNPISATSDSVASTTGLPLNGGQPLGFYDPETGRGAIALLNESPAENQNYVVWSQTPGTDGNPLLQNVGTVAAAGQPVVISFNTTANSATPPTFFVTLEPVDANAPTTPSGPVVAGPPPPNP